MALLAKQLVVTGSEITRILLGWSAVGVLQLFGSILEPPLSNTLLFGSLAAIIMVIVVCALGVVKQAEALARRLGDPYGSLVLTLSIVFIEVILIAAVMLGPGEHATIARDSVMAVSMIIMNLVIGVSLLVGGVRHGAMRHNRTGTSAYLAILIVLVTIAFVLPSVIGDDGEYTAGQELVITLGTLVIYAFFLFRQLGAQAGDFREVEQHVPSAPDQTMKGQKAEEIGQVLRKHRRELTTRMVLLVIMVLPIVLLSQSMAALVDSGLERLGAPTAFVGVLIALIVFLPESFTAVRAALHGEIQRVINLCHGALVSTVGLTIPVVLIIGQLTGQQVVLGETPANVLVLGVTFLLLVATFGTQRVTATHGAAHLVVFGIYVLSLFGCES